jgi:hypothetical protein
MQHAHLDRIHSDAFQHRINLVTHHLGWYTVVGHCLPCAMSKVLTFVSSHMEIKNFAVWQD